MSDEPKVEANHAQALVDIANEYRRLERQITSKTQQLSALLEANGEAGDFPTDFQGVRNRRYSIEFNFKPGEIVPQERSVTVESGTVFKCAAVESFLQAVGTANDPYSGNPVTVQAALPWNQRLKTFDYLWRIRDTGTDREWTNEPQPSLFGGGGYVGPLWLPRRIVLGGGTVVYAAVDPFLSNNDNPQAVGTFFTGGSIEQYVLHISLIGHETPDRSAL